MSLGLLMVDLAGHTLSDEDREILKHPLVGGVILFSRNYLYPEQIKRLTSEIHALRQPPLLIAVDHEGGKVQRFRQDFVRLPPAAKLGKVHGKNPRQAFNYAEQIGWLLAAELRAVGVDFSFAPVVDLKLGISTVVDDRAFHTHPEVVAEVAHAMMVGMRKAGMAAVVKHFPGHGSVVADSHHDIPVDDRRFVDIQLLDLVPFERMIHYGVPAIMPAHVIYSKVDGLPAGFSRRWLHDILRNQLGFQGAIFSDDMSMAAAAVIGDIVSRTQTALQAGCDMILICNDRPNVIRVLDNKSIPHSSPTSQVRLMRLHGRSALSWDELHRDERWAGAQNVCYLLEQTPELELNDDQLC